MSFYKTILKPLLFRSDPEKIHYRVVCWLKSALRNPLFRNISRSIFCYSNPALHRKVFGIDFPNPIGLAAGFDKDAKYVEELASLGFGFIEIGTVTPLPQSGNEKPRMFRLPEDSALINRMGFNNEGVSAAANRLRKLKGKVIIGGNIGKNKNTPNEDAAEDYLICFRELFDCVDYFVVNVSSPNTPGLRALQDKEPLLQLLDLVQAENKQRSVGGKLKPVLLKIAPDLSTEQLDEIIEVVVTASLDGVIATNTTLSREGLNTSVSHLKGIGQGGLSGIPLAKRATEVIRYLSEKAGNKFAIIGVGGIHSPDDALEKLNAGADLIQLYTGFIYEGPFLIKRINKEIFKRSR